MPECQPFCRPRTHCLHTHAYAYTCIIHSCTHTSYSVQCEEPSVSFHPSKGIEVTLIRAFLNTNNVICVAWLSNELGGGLHFKFCTNMHTDANAHEPTRCNYLLFFTSHHIPQGKYILPYAAFCDIHNIFMLALCYCLLADLGASHRHAQRNC